MKANLDASPSGAANATTLRAYYPLGTQERHELDEQLAQVKRLELEMRKIEEAKRNCVFRPKINEADEGNAREAQQVSVSTTSSSVFDRLREQARAREERQARREQEKLAQEEQNAQAGFRPQINRRTPFDANLKHLEDIPVEDRLLFYGKAVAKTAQIRREQKEREEQTATESLHAKSRHVDPCARRQAQEAFYERNTRLLLRREINRQVAAKKAAEQLTFQPKISATSAALDEAVKQQKASAEKSVAPRSASVPSSRVRAVAFEDLFPVTGFRNQCVTFTQPSPRVDRGTLLYEQALEAERRKADAQEREKLRERMEVHNGNQPRTNPLSDEWIQHSQHQKLFQKDFVSRQALYEAARLDLKSKLEEQKQREEQESRRGGVAKEPRTTVTADELKAQVDRLYCRSRSADVGADSREGQHRKHLLPAECPFKPQLSVGTEHVLRRMAGKREPDVVKRLAVPRTSTGDHDNDSADETTEGAGHSPPRPQSVRRELYDKSPGSDAKPTLAPPKRWDTSPARSSLPGATPTSTLASPNTQGRGGGGAGGCTPRQLSPEDMERFLERQRQLVEGKAEKVRRLRQRELVEELAECTFKPKTTVREGRWADGAGQPGSEDQTPTEARVSGVQQYLERQAMAKRLKEEKEERMRTMGLAKGGVAHQRTTAGHTIIAPFHLKTEKRREQATAAGEPGARHAMSLFALTTEERERALGQDELTAYDTMPEGFGYGILRERSPGRDMEADEEEDAESAMEVFEVHKSEPEAVEPRPGARPTGRLSSSSSSGGETCDPSRRGDGRRMRATGTSAGTSTFSSLKQMEGAVASSNSGRRKDANRSVSFVGVPPSPPKDPSRRIGQFYNDQYDVGSLLATLRKDHLQPMEQERG